MLDFHHCMALGLNKAIVRLGPEGVQKGRPGLAAEVGTLRLPC